jgi:anti-sigma factor RsiW
MVAALDDELGGRRRRALDRHLARCAGCREEMAVSARLADALALLPLAADVPAAIEQATLRRVRMLAADEGEGRIARAPWLRVFGPALATAGMVVLALVATLRLPSGRLPQRPAAEQTAARRREKPVAVADAAPPARATPRKHPPGPPPALAAAPELFVDLPLLHNMEKLEHFDAIRMTTLDDDDAGGAPQSNG